MGKKGGGKKGGKGKGGKAGGWQPIAVPDKPLMVRPKVGTFLTIIVRGVVWRVMDFTERVPASMKVFELHSMIRSRHGDGVVEFTLYKEEKHSRNKLDDMTATLGSLEFNSREEVVTPQGYSLDAVVQVQGRDVAVEVDGPRHFLGRAPTGKTLLKRRQLRAAEWALLAVPCTPIGCRARTPDPRMCALAGPCDSRLVCFAARRWRADWDWNWTLEQPQRQREYLASALERLLAEAKPLSDAAAPPTAEGLDAAGEQPRDGR